MGDKLGVWGEKEDRQRILYQSQGNFLVKSLKSKRPEYQFWLHDLVVFKFLTSLNLCFFTTKSAGKIE